MDRRWWQGATLYQLYVRSWQDSDGDGYGDLRGIIGRLDYLEWLGIDGVWLSPTMPSPDQDWGYDVSDYLGVHPELGSMEDLDALVAAASGRGMRVLLDLVPNHTSTQHPWFIESAASAQNPKRDYYVWADPAADGGPPNNWLDFTGQPAWQWDARTGQYYLHNFLAAQADLNWWNPAVHEEFSRVLRFWFDRGIAGFRIDVAHGLYKDALLRDNPPAEGDSPLGGRFGQRSVYNENRPEVHSVYRDWRSIADGYDPPRLLLGETWVGDVAALASFYGHDDELQLAFNFPMVFAGFTAEDLSSVVARTLDALPSGGCPVWTASNHDVGRFATRWCGGDQAKIRLALLVLATLPGTLVLYYGDEIGMPDVTVPPELTRDKLGGNSARPSRDRARTPMQWDGSPTGGFTAPGVVGWLPAGDLAACNVAAQRQDPGSVLSFCRDVLRVRRERAGGTCPRYERLESPSGVWRYSAADLEVTANLTDRQVTLPAPARGEMLLTTSGTRDLSDPATLAPWEGFISARTR
ncbi:MAG TPA: alpha-amylase family glycosyl hydrolase [Streptosporangiaceae bacterium]|nr:alpha-amylase family glycosyl hydrolase [Streptosporangiaceae bacterium]